jgi:hypothetical protein
VSTVSRTLKRISDTAQRAFCEREIILRSHAGLRYIVLTPSIQQVLAASFAFAIVSVVWITLGR